MAGSTAETDSFRFTSADGHTPVFVRTWLPADGRVSFILQIAHGMVDFADRYDEFARFIAGNGGAVYANDHLGHGHTTPEGEPFGYFGRPHGDALVVDDMHKLAQTARSRHPQVPFFLFGHSMGSLLARDYSVKYGSEDTGIIYSGTSGPNTLTGLVRLLAGVGFCFGRRRKPARLLSYLAFAKYNDQVPNPRTPNDWLTRDNDIVDAYCAHPWNSFQFTNQAAHDLATLTDRVSGMQWADRLPHGPAYLLISGGMDPVGDYGQGVREVYDWMKKAGIPDVQMRIYRESRHELTNELNRREVFDDILSFIREHI